MGLSAAASVDRADDDYIVQQLTELGARVISEAIHYIAMLRDRDRPAAIALRDGVLRPAEQGNWLEAEAGINAFRRNHYDREPYLRMHFSGVMTSLAPGIVTLARAERYGVI